MRTLLAFLLATALPAQDYPRISPFDGLRFKGDVAEVQLGEDWYQLLAINEIKTARILAFCREKHRSRAHKRFREDLVQVLSEMKRPPRSNDARLLLKDLVTGKSLQKTVRMTHEKRQRLRGARRAFRRGRYPKLSPFDGLRWNDDTPEVRIGKDWYRLVSFDGIAGEKIITFCKKRYDSLWRKRFGEDIVEVLAGMGHQAGRTARLKVRDLAGGPAKLLKDVPMTGEKRDAIRDASARTNNVGAELLRGRKLTGKQWQADLRELHALIRDRYSYRAMKEDLDVTAVFRTAAASLEDPTTVGEFGRAVMRILARFGDGHTRVQGSSLYLQPGFTPFTLVPHGRRLAALTPDAKRFLDPAHPYLAEIDDIAVGAWLTAASRIVPDGAPHFVRRHAARRLQSIQFARVELGAKPRSTIEIELASASGATTKKRLRVTGTPPAMRRYPPRGHRTLAGNVGYVRIPTMDRGRTFRLWLTHAMDELRKTKGLIVDVRGNGGGSREALRVLLPYFLQKDEPARVVNVGAARIAKPSAKGAQGLLANRFLHNADWPDWSPAARRAILQVAKSFRPDWELPEGEFSDWHYMVVERRSAPFHYTNPIVVLMDGGCFSATDIFLGGFKGVRNVTLMGETSGGGSGRSLGYRLPNSNISFRLSSMASFTRDGDRYDGKGIAPDVAVQPALRDLIGATDTVLDAAVKRLR